MSYDDNTNTNPNYINLQALRKQDEDDPIWVLNMSDRITTPKGDIYISCRRGDGNSVVLEVEATWLPVDLAEKAPRAAILNSSHFIDAVRSGIIQPITQAHAKELLESDSASEEKSRLRSRELVVKAANQVKGIGNNVKISSGDDNDFGDEKTNDLLSRANRSNGGPISVNDIDSPEVDLFPGVSPIFKSWVSKNNELSIEAAKNDLKVRGSLNGDEAAYYLEHTTHDRIRAYLKSKLN